jgi:hypothetical protein
MHHEFPFLVHTQIRKVGYDVLIGHGMRGGEATRARCGSWRAKFCGICSLFWWLHRGLGSGGARISGENQANLHCQTMPVIGASIVTLMKVLSMHFSHPRSGCFGGTLDQGNLHRTMATFDVVLPLGGIFLEQLPVEGEEVEPLRLQRSLRRRCQIMPNRQLLRPTMPSSVCATHDGSSGGF